MLDIKEVTAGANAGGPERAAGLGREHVSAVAIEGTQLLSRKETAAYLGLRPQTLAAWAVTGKYSLPFLKIGRSVRYEFSVVRKWASSRTVGVLAARTEAHSDN